MRRIKLALAMVVLSALPAAAATFTHGSKWVGQLTGEQTLTFSAPYATPCGGGDWSGCSYQAGGDILAVDDPNACSGWCGTTLGTFNIDAYNPIRSLMLEFTAWKDKYIVIHFTGQNPVNLDVKGVATPAPVPLPASAALLLGAFGGLAALRRRTRRAA